MSLMLFVMTSQNIMFRLALKVNLENYESIIHQIKIHTCCALYSFRYAPVIILKQV